MNITILYIATGIIFAVFLIIIASISIYNKLIRLKALNDEAWSGIDVQYKRRSDLIPNLVAIVKQYSIHEKDVLENVTKMRSIASTSTDMNQKAQAEVGITGALKTLFAVAENYPDLKANENFLELQRDLTRIEDELQLARRYYNGSARNYNTAIGSFPTNIIAQYFSFNSVFYIEFSSDSDRQAPKITF